MTREIQRRCPQCHFALPDPAAPVEARLLGRVSSVCTRHPPSACVIPAQGGIATVTVYPQVTKDTISCGEFADANEVAQATMGGH